MPAPPVSPPIESATPNRRTDGLNSLIRCRRLVRRRRKGCSAPDAGTGAATALVPRFSHPFMVRKRDGGFSYDTTGVRGPHRATWLPPPPEGKALSSFT